VLLDVFPGRDVVAKYNTSIKQFDYLFKTSSDMRAVLMVVCHSFDLPRELFATGTQFYREPHTTILTPSAEGLSSVSYEIPKGNKGRTLMLEDVPYIRACEFWVSEKTDGTSIIMECRVNHKPRFYVAGAWWECPHAKDCLITATLQVEAVGEPPPMNAGLLGGQQFWKANLWLTDPLMIQVPGLMSFRSRWRLAAALLRTRHGCDPPAGVDVNIKEWYPASEQVVTQLSHSCKEGLVFQPTVARPGVWHGFGSARYYKHRLSVDLEVKVKHVYVPEYSQDRQGGAKVFPARVVPVDLDEGIWEFPMELDGHILLKPIRYRIDKSEPNTPQNITGLANSLDLSTILHALALRVMRGHVYEVNQLCPCLFAMLESGDLRGVPDEIVNDTILLKEVYCLAASYASQLIFPNREISPLVRQELLEIRYEWYKRLLEGVLSPAELLSILESNGGSVQQAARGRGASSAFDIADLVRQKVRDQQEPFDVGKSSVAFNVDEEEDDD
jgi:hypothetical protein